MSVNTLKCTNCNVVISEVLAFIRNRHDVMDNESLIRICVSAFSEEEIDEAKKLLFTTTKTGKKCISRRKEKKQKDLDDMIYIFKTIDPDLLPIFVAYDLHKLPPVSFDHVDVTKLLKDLLVLRADITDIKSNYVTKSYLEDVNKQMIINRVSSPFLNSNINMNRRGGYNLNSGPIGLSHTLTAESNEHDVTTADVDRSSCLSENCASGSPVDTEALKHRSLVRTHEVAVSDVSSCHNVSVTPVNENVLEDTNITKTSIVEQAKPLTMAAMVRNGEWKKSKVDDDWTQVQRRKLRNRIESRTGRAVSTGFEKFKASESKIPLFISNVNKETTEKDICEYIQRMTQEYVTLEKIHMKKQKSYDAYKLFVSTSKLSSFLEDNLWPEGVIFRRFINFNKRNDNPQLATKTDNITKN